MAVPPDIAVSRLLSKIDALTFASSSTAVFPVMLPSAQNSEDATVAATKDNINAKLKLQLDDFPAVKVDFRNVGPAVAYYGQPTIPPPFAKPVRWMSWSKPEHPEVDEDIGEKNSCDSFGEPDLTALQGILSTAEYSRKVMQEKFRVLDELSNRENEKCDIEKRLREVLTQALNNAKNQTMAAVGDMVRDNDQLELHAEELTERLWQIETDGAAKLLEARQHAEMTVKALEKVVKEKDQTLMKITSEIKFLKNFAEEKEHMEASIEELRSAARERYQQQQRELDDIHHMQQEEQRKLQGIAADRLLTLTEFSYNTAFDNLDDNIVGTFYKNCQVQDAVAIWLQRNKQLKTEKVTLQKKLCYVNDRRNTAVKSLRHCGRKQDNLVANLRQLEQRYAKAHEAYKSQVDKYEQQCLQLVPVIQKQLCEKTQRLRALEQRKKVRRTEVQRCIQLQEIIKEEGSSMEDAFIWAIKQVQKLVEVDDVDSFSWEQKEMVFRRVFVFMNMEIQNVDQPFEQLCKSAEDYAAKLETNLSGLRNLNLSMVGPILPEVSKSTAHFPTLLPTSHCHDQSANRIRAAAAPLPEKLNFGFQVSTSK